MSEKRPIPKNANIEPVEVCSTCLKEPALCLCSEVTAVDTRLHVLILQHPQEPDKTLGSARLAHTALKNSTLKVGLSWPNLTKALGREAQNPRWAVLFLGGKLQANQLAETSKPGSRPPRLLIKPKHEKEFSAFTAEDARQLEGIIVLDGTWAQAKTLWWRNAWLLKLNRIVLNPMSKSLYGNLRKEPRRECLSTIEAIAEVLEALGEKPEAPQKLRGYFSQLLDRFRGLRKPAKPEQHQAQ